MRPSSQGPTGEYLVVKPAHVDVVSRPTHLFHDLDAKRHQALVAVAEGHYAEAAELYDEVLIAFPHDAALRQKFGFALSRLGRRDDAIAQYQHAIRDFAASADLGSAIALAKMVLKLDARNRSSHDLFIELCQQRTRILSGHG